MLMSIVLPTLSDDNLLRAISQEIPQSSLNTIHLKTTFTKFHSNVPEINESIVDIYFSLRSQCFHDNHCSHQVTCSDGFMVNLCGVLLKLCLPFCGKPDKLAKVKVEYPTSQACQLNYDFETCLAGGMIGK